MLVDATGERTFATTVGAEGRLAADRLAAVRPQAGDVVYISGYDLVYPHGPALTGWVAALPAGTVVVLDPGPLVADVEPGLLDAVLARATWLSLNDREARLATGAGDAAAASEVLLERAPGLAGVVVRLGAAGALLGLPGSEPVTVPGVPVRPGRRHQRRRRPARRDVRRCAGRRALRGRRGGGCQRRGRRAHLPAPQAAVTSGIQTLG